MNEQSQEESPEARAIFDRSNAAMQATGEAFDRFRRGEITMKQLKAAGKDLDACNRDMAALLKSMKGATR